MYILTGLQHQWIFSLKITQINKILLEMHECEYHEYVQCKYVISASKKISQKYRLFSIPLDLTKNITTLLKKGYIYLWWISISKGHHYLQKGRGQLPGGQYSLWNYDRNRLLLNRINFLCPPSPFIKSLLYHHTFVTFPSFINKVGPLNKEPCLFLAVACFL